MSNNARATIWYMDGEVALYYDERKSTSLEDRENMIEVLLVPSDILKSKYQITEDMLTIDTGDGLRGMWVEYKKEEIHHISRGINFPKVAILCDFHGARTDFQRQYDSNNLSLLIDDMRKENFNLQMMIVQKSDELRLLRTEINEYAQKLMDLDKIRGKEAGNYVDEDKTTNTNGG